MLKVHILNTLFIPFSAPTPFSASANLIWYDPLRLVLNDINCSKLIFGMAYLISKYQIYNQVTVKK